MHQVGAELNSETLHLVGGEFLLPSALVLWRHHVASFIQSWSSGLIVLCYSFALLRIRWDNFIRRTIGIHLSVMLINHRLRFIHCDFTF